MTHLDPERDPDPGLEAERHARGARLWQIAAVVVFALIVGMVVTAFAFLLNANADLRASNVTLYDDLTASQANADDLYQQLLELDVRPKGEDPEDVVSDGTPPPSPGPAGARGPAGEDGEDGRDGGEGPIGPQGIPGLMGPAGDDGDAVVGPQGETGAQGQVGPQGPPGASGVMESWSFTQLGVTYLCVINGTPPPFTYTCEPTIG